MNALWTWLPLLLIPLVIQYTLAPILIRFTNSHPASPEFEPVSIGQLPPDVAENFNRFIYSMSADGFVLAGYFRQLAYMRNVGFFLTLMKHPVTADIVYIIDIFTKGMTPIRNTFIEFCATFADGTEISTNNVQQPSVHKASPEMNVFRFPEVYNPNLLFELHRRLCARIEPAGKAVALAEGMEEFQLSYSTVKDVRRQVGFGYYYLDEKRNVYRPTLKGAYLMTWKLVWPMKMVLKARMRSSGRATMRSLGF